MKHNLTSDSFKSVHPKEICNDIYARFYWSEEKKRMLESYFTDGKNILKYIVGFLYPQDSRLHTEPTIDQKILGKKFTCIKQIHVLSPMSLCPKQHRVTNASKVSYYRMINILTMMYSTWEEEHRLQGLALLNFSFFLSFFFYFFL